MFKTCNITEHPYEIKKYEIYHEVIFNQTITHEGLTTVSRGFDQKE
jgi:hypothetical protein